MTRFNFSFILVIFLLSLFVFDSEQMYTKSNRFHELMTPHELGYYFGAQPHHGEPRYQVVYLPVVMPREAQRSMEDGGPGHMEDEEINYDFNAFGRDVQLKLKPNRKLVSPNFKLNLHDKEFGEPEELRMDDAVDCHYLHRRGGSVAAISMCQEDIIHGLIFLDNATLEIKPLTPRLKSLFKLQEALKEEPSNEDDSTRNRIPHIIHWATLEPAMMRDDFILFPSNERNDHDDFSARSSEEYKDSGRDSSYRMKRKAAQYTVEVALFFDEAGYKIFAPYLNNNEKEMRDMLLAYMNGVQALYHLPSLGTPVDLTLVRMDLLQRQPADLLHHGGERSLLLDSFCDYQKRNNPKGDEHPDHWDMGLYVSGLDFYAIENGRRSGVTMGLATVGGVCLEKYACVIAELGTTNAFGKPYPSAGFTSVYILAHEIGHNLGMHHDSSGNSCSKDGFIMSPSRGTNGETVWSRCSAQVMTKLGSLKCLLDSPSSPPAGLDHGRYGGVPGQAWGAKRQCEVLLRDKDAAPSVAGGLSRESMCQQLQCRTPHRSGYYHAGPALEGTECGDDKWCQGGSCVKMVKKKPAVEQKGGWSKWKVGDCRSGCLQKGQGFLSKTRTCDNPKPVNTEQGCEGNSFEVNLCKDNKVCSRRRRLSVVEYAAVKCREFSEKLPELDPEGAGLQAPHEESRLWMSCAIFCRRADSGGYYTPRIDLNDLGEDPYFPDGTWCHSSGEENYYCLQHHCLPESFKFTKLWGDLGSDVPISGNARPPGAHLPPELLEYLSLGADGLPLLTELHPGQWETLQQDQWISKDYLEMPQERDAQEEED